MRALGTVGAWLAAAVLGAAAAAGDSLPEDARRRADETFASAARGEALYADLDVVLRGAVDPVDREPLRVRDLYWRPVGAGATPEADVDPPAKDLAGRRRAWLSAKGLDADGTPAEYPVPAEGEAESYPKITALVLDRLRRERRGFGDPERGPLAGQEWAKPILEMRARALRGTTDADRSPEQLDARARRDRATQRNRLLGLGAVGVLVALSLVGFVLLGRLERAGAAP